MSQGQSPSGGVPPPAAAPPSRSEIERKLSFKSAARPSAQPSNESPKKNKKPNMYLSSAQMQPNMTSGNDSDTSSIASSSHPYTGPTSPAQASTPGMGSLSAFSERKGSTAIPSVLENFEEEGEEEEAIELEVDEGEGSASEDELQEQVQGDLARGMEGERVVKSGYLWKKQERRNAWKKKWFVLRTGKLAYYKDDREYSLKRVIELKSVHTVAPVTVKKHSFAFGIVTSKRTFLVKASSPDEMEDWVRAVNGLRRKLSEREEDERNKRENKALGIAIPPRQTTSGDGTDVHHGTYSTTYTTAGSISGSPIATTGYFAPKISSSTNQTYSMGMGISGSQNQTPTSAVPASPMDTTNHLSAQMARVAIPRTPSTSAAQSRSVSSNRRDLSASSVGSSRGYGTNDYMSRNTQPMPVSSDEDEPYFSDPVAGLGMSVGTTASMTPSASGMGLAVDPKKIILSAYLMKRSKGRGRKVWKKRWFFLTSQGLTYTKSHMDSRPLRNIPLSSVLDALDFESGESSSDADDSDNSPSIASSAPTRQFSQLRQGGRSKDGHGPSAEKTHPSDDHTFRIVTAKRTFVLCAPTEEDEIKWLAAFRALLNRERWGAIASGNGLMSPSISTATGMGGEPSSSGSQWAQASNPSTGFNPGSLPRITAQPPTPASQASVSSPSGLGTGTSIDTTGMRPLGTPMGSSDNGPPTPSVSTSQGPPTQIWDPSQGQGGTVAPTGSGGGAPGLRGRSATFNAKKAVADVVRRYHPDPQGQGQAQAQN